MLKIIAVALAALFVVGGIVFALGPREEVDEIVSFDASKLGDDLDAYLVGREGNIKNLVAGAQKQIVWADPADKRKREYAVVYIHGFSATLEETRPLPDLIAKDLGANLFFTRLKGHGRDGSAMAEATVNDWYNDVAEAFAIGRRLGEKVIIVSTSTGGTLASWALGQSQHNKNIVASIKLSPNFAVNDPGAKFLTIPWSRYLLPILFGENRSFEPKNEGQAKWWTYEYPNVALIPMQASVEQANALAFENMTVPSLFIFHPDDGVVDSNVTREIAKRWGDSTGALSTTHEISQSTDTHHHVIAGDILNPGNTVPLATKSLEWIKSL